MPERIVNGKVQKRKVIQVNVTLYPEEKAMVETLRARYRLDSVSQTVRRLIQDAHKQQEEQAA